ncbi:class I SAM-dependent methyltransferase [bacterium]|nr:class I SAM-dependent methyltransferase [candidate division CSSED10-310 bacterium]
MEPNKAGEYLAQTRQWLNRRFDVFDGEGIYVPNHSSYGFSALAFRLEEYARSYALLRMFNRLEFSSLLDIGCADGYFPALIRALFEVQVTGSDLSDRAMVRARSLHSVTGCALDAHRLPFPDESFDAVLASELLEHVTGPGQVIAEMKRVAKKYVIITTPRARDRADVRRHFRELDPGEPHAHIHYFTDGEIRNLCGDRGFYFGARSRWVQRILNRLAWGDDTTRMQRQAYLDFTLESAMLSETSREAVRYALIGRYSTGGEWRKMILGPGTLSRLLRLDVAIAETRPDQAYDHLAVLPAGRMPVPGRKKLPDGSLLEILLRDFAVRPLRIDSR